MSKKFKYQVIAKALSVYCAATGQKICTNIPTSPDFKTIIVYSTTALGDFMFATPAIRSLRLRFPQARIALVVHEKFRSFINEQYQQVDEVFYYGSEWHGFFKFVGQLRKFAPEAAVLFHSHPPYDIASAVLANCCYLFKGGYSEQFSAFEPFFTYHSGHFQSAHLVTARLDLIKPLGCQTENVDMQIPCEYPHYPRIKDKFVIGFQMGTSQASRGRRWPVESYVSLARQLIRRSERVEIVLVGIHSEQELAQQFFSLLPQNIHNRIIDQVGKTTLPELLGILEQMDLLVTPDTGTMHLAVALKTPLAVILPSLVSNGAEPIQDKEIHILIRPTKEVIDNNQIDASNSISPDDVFEAIVTKWAEYIAEI